MLRSNAPRASDVGMVLLAAALTTAVLAVVRLLPPADLAAADLGWITPALGVVLIIVAAAAALVCLVAGIRRGALALLFGTAAAASVAGGSLAHLAGAGSMAVALLAGAVFLLAAAAADRREALVGRATARIALAAGLLVAAEAAALVHIIPGVALVVSPHDQTLLLLAAGATIAAAVAGAGRGFGPVGMAATLGVLAVLLDRGGGLELVIGLGVLASAHLAGIRLLAAREPTIVEDDGARLPQLAAHLPDAVLHFDGYLRLREWNRAAGALLGLDETSIGSRLEDLLALTMAEIPAAGTSTIVSTATGGLQIRLIRAGEGVTTIVHDTAATTDGERLGRELRGTIEELLEARRTIELQRAELDRSATVDPLTGVSSRGAILDRLQTEVAQARRYRHPVAVVLLDVDGFAELNHRIGVSGGDTLLREVALRMRLRVREADAIGRAGSDGFLAVLPHTDEGGAATFAAALRHRLGQRPILVGDELVSLTVSVGVAVMRPGEDLDLDGLLARVGEALDSARGAGGDRIALDRLHGLARLDDRGGDLLPDEPKAQDSGA